MGIILRQIVSDNTFLNLHFHWLPCPLWAAGLVVVTSKGGPRCYLEKWCVDCWNKKHKCTAWQNLKVLNFRVCGAYINHYCLYGWSSAWMHVVPGVANGKQSCWTATRSWLCVPPNETSDQKEKLAIEAAECNLLLPHLLKNKSFGVLACKYQLFCFPTKYILDVD